MNDDELEVAIKQAHSNLMQLKRMHEEIKKPYVKALVDLMALRTTSGLVFVDGAMLRLVPIDVALSQGGGAS